MVVFAHNNLRVSKRGTVALELPSKLELETMLTQHINHLLMNIGITLLHPKDNFVKKIGREESIKKLKNIKVSLNYVEVRNTKHVYIFNAIDNKKEISFGLSTMKESDQVKLIYCSLFDLEDNNGNN